MKIEIPNTCPSCDASLERVKDQLFCRNPNCGEQQIKKVVGFAKKMKIKGLGEKTIEKLDIRSIPAIYEIDQETATAVIGEKLAAKLIQELNKAKEADLAVFLSACSIPLIGLTAARKVASVVDNPSEINTEKCKESGLGDKATANLVNWVVTEYMDNLITLPVKFLAKDTDDLIETEYKATICITGRVPGFTKSALAEKLATQGIRVVNSVTKDIDYLLCEDKKGSAKEKKATSYGINIVTLNELIMEIN